MRPTYTWLIGLLMASTLQAENYLRFAKPVTIPALDEEDLVSVNLDREIYRATQDGFPDLRILTGTNDSTAYVIRRKQAKVSRKVKQTWPAEDLRLQPLADGGLEIEFRIDVKNHPHPPQGIRLVTPLRNFERHLRIDSSPDGENWQPLVADAIIFDYSQYMDVHNTQVEFPSRDLTPQAWMRITIDDVTQEQQSQLLELSRHLQGGEEASRTERFIVNRQPFRIDRIELWHDEMQIDVASDARQQYRPRIVNTEQNNKNKETILTFESEREPVTRFRLQTDDRNFCRIGRIEVQRHDGERDVWQTVGRANLMRIAIRDLKQESLQIEIPEHRERQYRLVIENGDSAPLAIRTVEEEGPVHELIFLAKPDADYQVAFGSEQVERPDFDTLALTASLQEGYQPQAAELGPATERVVDAPPAGPLLKQLLNNTTVLTIGIAALAVLLALGLYRATGTLNRAE